MAHTHELASCAELNMKSSWQAEKHFSNGVAQTMAVAFCEEEAQTTVSALQASETLDKAEGTGSVADRAPPAKQSGSGWVYPGEHFDDDSVAAFLAEVHEELTEELVANCKSSAFDAYEANWKAKKDTLALSTTLTPPFALEQEWHATGLEWNVSGTSVAVSYGRIDTTAWCQQKGYACVWHFLGAVDEGKPNVTLEADSYITALAFHPTKPSLLAGGTYNGEVLLWNLTEEGAKPMSSVGFSMGPREPLSQLQWVQDLREARDSHRYVLCTASADGKILFWSPTNKFKEAISGYEVHNKKRAVVGVQSLSFVSGGIGGFGQHTVPGVESVMLLGLESGDVFRTKPGNSMQAAAAANQPAASGFSVLEVDHFEAHLGPVQSVDCSPFFRNLFLTCSSDGAVRLYSTLERAHLAVLEPTQETKHFLYAAEFSPSRPSVFAAVSRNSQMYIYDLAESRATPSAVVDVGTDGCPVLSVAFNKADASLLATGDAKGVVKVWHLASTLSEPTDLERAAVRQTEVGVASPSKTAGGEAGPTVRGGTALRQLFGFGF
jgi:hypothetical protein